MTPKNMRVALATLKPHPRNYNRHPASQVERIAASLRKFGQVRSIVVWRSTILAGHGVVEAARALGWTELNADVLPDDYPEHLALAYVAADNELGRLGDPDQAALAAILEESRNADADLLEAIGYSDAEFESLLAEVGAAEKPTTADTEPQIDRAEELRQKWGVNVGDLWQLGEHRLICGDCTDAAVVERVMGGERADLMIADPEYDASMDWLSLAAFDAIPHWLIMASDRQHMQAAQRFGERFNQFLVVYFKQFSWNLNIYIPILQHLCVAHYRRKDAKNYDLNGLHSIIECSSKFDRQTEHPHAKHVAITEPLIAGFSPKQCVTLDLFSGSGTTIIACENLGRRCRAVEIAPGYVAVALERWATHTGKTPVLIG